MLGRSIRPGDADANRVRHINQLQPRRADALNQRRNTAFVSREFNAFRQRAGEFEKVVFLNAMPPKPGYRSKSRAARNTQFTRLLE